MPFLYYTYFLSSNCLPPLPLQTLPSRYAYDVISRRKTVLFRFSLWSNVYVYAYIYSFCFDCGIRKTVLTEIEGYYGLPAIETPIIDNQASYVVTNYSIS